MVFQYSFNGLYFDIRMHLENGSVRLVWLIFAIGQFLIYRVEKILIYFELKDYIALSSLKMVLLL